MDAVDIIDLVGRARTGERAAWDALVDEFASVVWATVRRFRLSEAEAADAAQTTWLRLVEHLDAIKDPACIAGWLRTTARRVCLERVRETSRVVVVDPHEDSRLEVAIGRDDASTPERLVVANDEVMLVRTALATLDQRDRMLLTLLTSPDGISYREIAERMGIPVGSVGPTRGRALVRLRVALEAVGVVDSAR